jgi:hypothetical protein
MVGSLAGQGDSLAWEAGLRRGLPQPSAHPPTLSRVRKGQSWVLCLNPAYTDQHWGNSTDGRLPSNKVFAMAAASPASAALQVTPGALVVVAGRSRLDDPLQSNIHNVTNAAYNLFRTHGYPPERIFYLATDMLLDADGDEVPDVDALVSLANLEFALTQWAVDKVGPDRFLTIYMMDHAAYDTLCAL